MSVKRAFGVLAWAIAVGGVGSAVIVGASASGTPATTHAPAAAFAPALPPAAAANDLQAVPKTTLHLPSTLHLLVRIAGLKTLDSSHSVLTAGVTKPGSSRVIGTAAYTCTSSSTVKQDCDGALALRKGTILLHQAFDFTTGQITGSVIAGSGYYEGAQGNVSGRALGGGKNRLTIDYAFS